MHVFRKVFAVLSFENVYNVRDGVYNVLRVYPQFLQSIVISLEAATVSLLSDKKVFADESTRPTCTDVQMILMLYRHTLKNSTPEGTRVNRSGRQSNMFVDIIGHDTVSNPRDNNAADNRIVNSDLIVEVFYKVCECLVNLTLSETEEEEEYETSKMDTSYYNRLQAVISIVVPSSSSSTGHFRFVCIKVYLCSVYVPRL